MEVQRRQQSAEDDGESGLDVLDGRIGELLVNGELEVNSSRAFASSAFWLR